MEINCDISVAGAYKSSAQIARVISETWLAKNGYCLACDKNSLDRFAQNTRCTDFICPACGSRYELKTFRKRPSTSLVDGAYSALMSRIIDGSMPTFLLLGRSESWAVTDLTAIHPLFLTPSVIQERKPLSETAVRAGWVGCNIRLDRIGPDGEIQMISAGEVRSRSEVRQQFRFFAPLKNLSLAERGWTTITLSVVPALGKPRFALADLYEREQTFSACYPGNKNVRPKIRQQLQVLRDLGLLGFDGRGKYTIMS